MLTAFCIVWSVCSPPTLHALSVGDDASQLLWCSPFFVTAQNDCAIVDSEKCHCECDDDDDGDTDGSRNIEKVVLLAMI